MSNRFEIAFLAMCAEAEIAGARIHTIVCDEAAAAILHGDGARLSTANGEVVVRVEPTETTVRINPEAAT